MKIKSIFLLGCALGLLSSELEANRYIIGVEAPNKFVRTRIANMGIALDEVRSDRVYFQGDEQLVQKLRKAGFNIEVNEYQAHWDRFDIEAPPGNARYRSYSQAVEALQELVRRAPDIASLGSLGQSTENRDMPVLRISGKTPLEAEQQDTPTILYQGCHHAREHMSMEVPLRFAEYLVEEYGRNADVTRLVDNREIYIAPVINPDGHVYDYTDGVRGRNWRKNRRRNADGSTGVDLNRNYAYGWGGQGSSSTPSSDTYRGASAFSEVETQNLRDFIVAQDRMQLLMDFHSFSELILYPWGNVYDPIEDPTDRDTHRIMAETMAQWNQYTPQSAADLYLASGTSLDWIYGSLGIINFTFELSPRSMWEGGFYPNPNRIEATFEANLQPMLYMLEYADDPSRVLREQRPDFSPSLAEQGAALASFDDISI